jgi:hypothetical protein
LLLYDNNGQPLVLNLGNGTGSKFNFSVAPSGTVTLTSSGTSSGVTGWAVATSSMPLQSVARYQYAVNGAWQQGVSVPATPATYQFSSPATAQSGIALANPWSNDITLEVSLYDEHGRSFSISKFISLGPLAHVSFNLLDAFSGLPGSFRGSVQISGEPTPTMTYFAALVLSGDGGVLSSYPPGVAAWPPSEYQRVSKVWTKILNQAIAAFPVIANFPPGLILDPTTKEINAYARWPANTVQIDYSLAELLSDSDSELAFVIGHEVGHIIQYQSAGKLNFVPTDKEWDADIYGFLLSLGAGYDPYAVGGAFGKLMMANGSASLESEQALVNSGDPHGSFNDRIANIFRDVTILCQGQISGTCVTYKNGFHPHLPGMDPLMKRGQADTQNTGGQE